MTPIHETIINKRTNSSPIWLMRQAGRYLPACLINHTGVFVTFLLIIVSSIGVIIISKYISIVLVVGYVNKESYFL